MAGESPPDLSLFLEVLQKLEAIGAPYMVIGGFAAAIYGISRATRDIDIVVDLTEEHIQALAAAYPLPRYYADPYQMRHAIRLGTMFNIIDMDRGEKADLAPITMDARYRPAFQRRVRQTIDLPGIQPLLIWCARPEDVIVGKLVAWREGGSRRHETDIYEMLVFHFLATGAPEGPTFNEAFVDEQAGLLGEKVAQFWQTVKAAARAEAGRLSEA